MKRFLIHVDTNWCGEEEGYDPDEMTDEDWDEMWSRIYS